MPFMIQITFCNHTMITVKWSSGETGVYELTSLGWDFFYFFIFCNQENERMTSQEASKIWVIKNRREVPMTPNFLEEQQGG